MAMVRVGKIWTQVQGNIEYTCLKINYEKSKNSPNNWRGGEGWILLNTSSNIFLKDRVVDIYIIPPFWAARVN